MRALVDRTHVLDSGLVAIREQFAVPDGFGPDVAAAAEQAARRVPKGHVDRTNWPFVTLDPAYSTDLDQAFTIDKVGNELLLHYAIADVAWFVSDGDALDGEAWRRGSTIYLPDGKAALYPRELAEGAASLLPDGPRPAVVFHVRLSPEGKSRLDGAERAIIRSRAKLAYDSVKAGDLPDGFEEFAHRVMSAADERGVGAVQPPEQAVERRDGSYRLEFRPRSASESNNAALSLATNLAVADAMVAAGTGLFRVMAGPDERALRRLRHTAKAFGISWAEHESLETLTRRLDPNLPGDAALMMAVRRAGGGADYVPFVAGVTPWHAAMAATYAHVTAPLRRLADRYVVQTALALATGVAVPDHVQAALQRLPEAMDRAEVISSRIERAVIDLAEAVMLQGREGEIFDAVVVDDDEDASRVQLRELAVVARVQARSVRPGDEVRVKLVKVDVRARTVQFDRVA
ncbi:MAG: RNB domain-containing ribonuclease [Actinobacteria bacterium]|nr:RNB domain-containing ribonuclease [Actinomycetota bacterium]